MNIVFFGTGKFSATILDGMVSSGLNVVAVVSQIDKANARNNKVIFSPIKEYCINHNIPLYQFARLNTEGEDILRSLNPDVFVTASFGQIIKENILSIPKFGTVNVHASLLPKYRGPAPIQAAIMNGEKKTGITIMRTDIGVDTGDIYFSREIDILPDDTATTMFEKLANLGVVCIREFFDRFDYYIAHPMPQDNTKATYFPMIKKEDYLLDFNMCAFDLCNKIRALENCYFVFNGMRYKVLFAVVSEYTGEVGQVIKCNSRDGLIIGCRDKSIEVVHIQPEGKQKLLAMAYMNANKFHEGDMIENT